MIATATTTSPVITIFYMSTVIALLLLLMLVMFVVAVAPPTTTTFLLRTVRLPRFRIPVTTMIVSVHVFYPLFCALPSFPEQPVVLVEVGARRGAVSICVPIPEQEREGARFSE